MLYESRTNGVVEDVLDRGGELPLRLDRPAGEAVAPQVAPAAVSAVEALRVDAVQALHAERELLARALQHEVVVVAHQAERVHRPRATLDDLAEQREEREPVVVGEEHEALLDAARRDVEVAVREQRAERSRHLPRR
ncbi:MAG TPA: hypothetical protein VNT23_02940 [Gaiellaceae bacterium]|nr:hypothetical protein [Gaiellaceae bacterium]